MRVIANGVFNFEGSRSIDKYRESYAQSINEPDKFWGDIADTFYWKKRWNTLTRSNFDCKKGPISIGIDFFLSGAERRH